MQKKYIGYVFVLMLSLSCLSYGNLILRTNTTDLESDVDIQTEVCVDAWVIIAGDRPDHAESSLILATSELVYSTLLACGYTDDDIFYMAPEYTRNDTEHEDAKTSASMIHSAVGAWAAQHVSPNGALGVYICDHGGYNSFAIYPDSPLEAWKLDSDIDQGEAASGSSRTIVIYDACESGSWIEEMSEIDRIVVTSTDDLHGSYFSAIPPHRLMFSDSFWPAIQAGKSIGEAFEEATADIIALGYGQKEFPCIDDNHDDIGHIVNAWGCLPSTDDGYVALNTYLCTSCHSAIKLNLPHFLQISKPQWMVFTPGIMMIPIEVQIQNQTPIANVICRIVPMNWTPPTPSENESGIYDPNESLYQWSLSYNGNGNYSGIVELLSPVNNTEYRLSFIIEDVNGKKGRILDSRVTLNGDGIAPPDITNPSLYITNPASGANVGGTVEITAKGNDDQELDSVQLYLDGVLVNTTTMTGYLPYPDAVFTCNTIDYENGLHNITATAMDKTGNTNTTSLLFKINNTSGIPGFQVAFVLFGCLLVVITLNITMQRKRRII